MNVVSVCLMTGFLAAGLGEPPTDKLHKRFDSLSLTGFDGKRFALAELKEPKAVVLVFLSPDCPVSNAYASVLAEFAASYGKRGVTFFGIAPSDDVPAELHKRFAEFKLPFPVCPDPKLDAATTFKAVAVPEVFVLDASLTLRYRGRIDNAYSARLKKNPTTTEHNLLDALDAILAGKSIATPATDPIGCPISVKERVADTNAGVSYYRDVVSILQTHCQDCHRPNQVGPFSLMTYKQAVNWADDIKSYTHNRAMPPWKPEPGPAYANQRSMPEKDIATLAKWVDAGCPEGDPKDAPPAKSFPTDWQRGTPDLIVELPDEMHIAATGHDLFRCFVFPTGFDEDKYITAYEVKPGNPGVVHHTLNYYDTTGKARELAQREARRTAGKNEPDYGPGYSVAMGLGFIPDFSKYVPGQPMPVGMFGGWAPGQRAISTPAQSAYLLPKGADIIIQVHYHRTGKAETDRTKVGLYFAKKPTEKVFQVLTVGGMSPFTKIPAGKSNYTAKGSLWLATDADVHSVLPHMHLIGRSIRVRMTPPDGPTQSLVDIRDWDYNWQESYWFKEPLRAKAGTRFDVEAVYDNSSRNPHNPSRPPKTVFFGEETTSEMLYGFIGVTPVNTPRVRTMRKTAEADGKEKTHEIPYRLTDTKHVMVRIKINGKGPFNLILDTGAPAMFVTKKVAKQAGLEAKDKGWANIDSLVLEGGMPIEKARCRVHDLFQLEGMNSLGLAGTELHGVIGYEMLARFRITYDFTKDKLTWVPLDFTPPSIVGIGGSNSQGGLEMIGPIVKILGGIMGIEPNFNAGPRGFLGVVLTDGKDGIVVEDIWPGGPGEKAGLKKGDVIAAVKSNEITKAADLHKLTAKMKPGDRVSFTVKRDGKDESLTVSLGKGF
jgi:peroxiredoxin/mono/diheme cytochrome c family protein